MFQLRNVILTNFLSLIFLSSVLGLSLRDRRTVFADPTLPFPCSRIVFVESQGLLNYLATVKFRAPVDFVGKWQLEMDTNNPFAFFGSWGVTTKSDGQNKRADMQSAQEVRLAAGDIITFRFRVSYGRNQPIPYASEITWQGRQICRTVTELKMENEMQGDIWTRNIEAMKKNNLF